MNHQRHIAITAILAMLLGNMAGWVHVGCVHESCTIGAAELASSSETSEQLVGRSKGSGHHGCCHHSTGESAESKAADSCSGESDTPEHAPHDSEHSPHDPEHSPHDSEHSPHEPGQCSVCQGFFTTRQACVATTVVPSISVEVACQWLPWPSTRVDCRPQLDSTSVRGPPIA